MTIFRYKKDGKLYKIYKIVRSMCLCRCKGYEAIPLYHTGSFVLVKSLEDFEVVSHR